MFTGVPEFGYFQSLRLWETDSSLGCLSELP